MNDESENQLLQEGQIEEGGPEIDSPTQVVGANSFRFLTDQNVPDSVGLTLMNAGHDVVRLRDIMAVDTTDPIVAKAAMEDNRILLSWDRDFNQQRFMAPRFARLSRLSMSGAEMSGADRLLQVMDLIEFVLRRASGEPVAIRVGVGKLQLRI